jgi:hypothetical protein
VTIYIYILYISIGMCSCDSGYEGVDCSVVLQDPPTVLGVLGGALCDLVDMSCTDIMVFGINFFKNVELSCLITETEVSHFCF